jgi:hypothetical protein
MITLEMRNKLDAVAHRQQNILKHLKLGSTSSTSATPCIPTSMSLPAQTMDQIQVIERNLLASPSDVKSLVCKIVDCLQSSKNKY